MFAGAGAVYLSRSGLHIASRRHCPRSVPSHFSFGATFTWRHIVKWAGMFLFGFVILLGGVVAALWKLGVLARIGMTWTLIGLVIAVGLGIMISVGSSGAKENIQIDRK